MKKNYIIAFLLILSLTICPSVISFVSANGGDPQEYVPAEEFEVHFMVYDEEDNFIFESVDVQTGDIYIDKNFNVYEVYLVDEVGQTAKARLTETIKKPHITRKLAERADSAQIAKKIGLYMTHNDESFVTGDGYDSIYGPGGIHDVARLLKKELSEKNINVTLDETLHIPHNSSAYSRSEATAKKLLQDNNAIFDIHRDGVSRQYYAVNYDGKERCQIRITVGQANPDKAKNLQFALYLMSVAEATCPWLFSDIYYAKGHYNQGLSPKALLFECGTYLMEKDKVLESIPYLADVINTTLFNTTINEETGEITIGKTDVSGGNSVDNILDNGGNDNSFQGNVTTPDTLNKKETLSGGAIAGIVISCIVLSAIIGYLIYMMQKKMKETNVDNNLE